MGPQDGGCNLIREASFSPDQLPGGRVVAFSLMVEPPTLMVIVSPSR
jgi:hypothetical protein